MCDFATSGGYPFAAPIMYYAVEDMHLHIYKTCFYSDPYFTTLVVPLCVYGHVKTHSLCHKIFFPTEKRGAFLNLLYHPDYLPAF